MRAVVSRRAFLKRVPGTLIGFYLLTELPAWARPGSRHSRSVVERTFFAMGSTASLRAYGSDRNLLMQATTKVIEEFQRIENALSLFRASSDVARVNAAAGRMEVTAGEDLFDVVEWSLRVSKITHGAFDITVGPLMHLWGFRSMTPAGLPDDATLRRILDAVGPDKLVVDRKAKTLALAHPDARMDLGGVGVGYALDRAAAILKTEGVESALINHSGDAVMFGMPDDADGWELGIPNPASPDTIVKRLLVTDGAIATSGGYRQCVTIGSHRFAHIIDPRSGLPGRTLLSTTVLAPDAIMADTLSTSTFCLSAGETDAVLEYFPKTSFLECTREGVTRERGSEMKEHRWKERK